MLDLEIEIFTERGGRSYNEDACGHWQTAERMCCVLADGAGGHGGGDVAAQLAVRELLRALAAYPSTSGQALADLVRGVNQALIDSRAPGPTQNMHTTVVSLVVDLASHAAHWAHAGDSRLYWFRDGALLRRTRDHSVVQALVDAGMWEADAAKQHPSGNQLVSALGMPTPDLGVGFDDGPVQPGDALLLCTDGCWEHLHDQAMVDALAAADTPRAWLADLRARVHAATLALPRHDNYTALAVWASAAPAADEPDPWKD